MIEIFVCENNERPKAVNNSRKDIHRRCLAGS